MANSEKVDHPFGGGAVIEEPFQRRSGAQLEDLKKAAWYLRRKIEQIEKSQSSSTA